MAAWSLLLLEEIKTKILICSENAIKRISKFRKDTKMYHD